MYFFFKMILKALFWILSKSSIFWAVRLACHTTALCSRILLMYAMYMFFNSSVGAPNSDILCNNLILAFALLVRFEVLLSHFRSFWIIVPRSFCSGTTSMVVRRGGGRLYVNSVPKLPTLCNSGQVIILNIVVAVQLNRNTISSVPPW